ncbi:hypothetical protein J6T21_04440 [Candidatus Saccharibacteria bacterium]|nr:hypothetical protein [Candidatus Saccharibacteria bacterium]
MMNIHFTENGKMIWDSYYCYRLTSMVNRAGFRLTSAYKDSPRTVEPTDSFPVDSDMTHSAGFCKLMSLISFFYPEIIPPSDILMYHTVAEIHDFGEVFEGDAPNDGTRDSVRRDPLERSAVIEHVEMGYPKEYVSLILENFDHFQKKDDYFGLTIGILDGLESILAGLFQEKIGMRHCILDKFLVYGRPETGIDIAATEFTQTTKVPDNFLYRQMVEPYFFKHPYINVFLEIIQSAAYVVRGEEMKWLNPELKKFLS